MEAAFRARQVIDDIVKLLRMYGITEVRGDNAGAGFHQEDWRSHPVAYLKCEDTTSENYLTALPSFLAKRVRLVDNVTLRNQLATLERRVGAGDKENVSHPQHANAHDDIAAAICGVVTMALRRARVAAMQPNIHVPPDLSATACGIVVPGSMGDSWSPPSTW